ncbi:DUF6114 domain-containing protein [Streptomyces sp. AC550_RSS872]|uniref:DUF6114 domain-containing protein n=1 Tax=Streptomyces sp. AC550_RSS872 TaxID=2823689 RepID=UPI001C27DA71|nr:DUF6114 domain-containing protein [Streptomyces sp. AC550_RSS872]
MPVRRGRRPVAASVCTAASGAELGYLPLADPGMLPVLGTSGATAVMLAFTLAGCAVHMWTRPTRAAYSGGAAVALGLLSYPLANLGGFLLGMVLALLGGSLALAWQPPLAHAPAHGGALEGRAPRTADDARNDR